MAFHTLSGLMTDVTATEITSGRFSVSIFSLVCHPVAAKMGDRFLVLMAVGAVSSGMAGGADATIMGCFNPVAGGFPAKSVVFRFLGLMALFTKSLAAGVAA